MLLHFFDVDRTRVIPELGSKTETVKVEASMAAWDTAPEDWLGSVMSAEAGKSEPLTDSRLPCRRAIAESRSETTEFQRGSLGFSFGNSFQSRFNSSVENYCPWFALTLWNSSTVIGVSQTCLSNLRKAFAGLFRPTPRRYHRQGMLRSGKVDAPFSDRAAANSE